MRRYLFPMVIGICGAAVLISLGLWQLRRLDWKEAYLAEIAAQIGGDPIALPQSFDPETDRFLPVQVAGQFTGGQLRVLSGVKGIGPGHRLIAAFETDDGRRILIDRGFLPQQAPGGTPPDGAVQVTGNLHWPREADKFTPEPDLKADLWFARDVPAMAAHLDTEEVLIVARQVTGDTGDVLPQPVDTSGIPNDHLEYALTWFGLTIVWLGMTALLMWRIRRKTV